MTSATVFLNHRHLFFPQRRGNSSIVYPPLFFVFSYQFNFSFPFRDPPSRRARTPFHLRVILYLGPRQVSSRPRLEGRKKKMRFILINHQSLSSLKGGGQPKKNLIFNWKGKKENGGKKIRRAAFIHANRLGLNMARKVR